MTRNVLAILCCLAAACAPYLGPPASLINGPRILAIRGNPPEALPGGPPGGRIAYDILAVTPDGRLPATPASWAYCTTPRPPATNNVIGGDCLLGANAPLGADGPTATASMPQNACSIYGPDQPPPVAGQPPARPPDPDATGGYYQPVLVGVEFPGDPDGGFYQAAMLERIRCNLPSAPANISQEYTATYTLNLNPVLAEVTATLDGGTTQTLSEAGDGGPAILFPVPVGATVALTASWPSSSVENFPVFDLSTRELVTQTEALTLAWYATAGTMGVDLTVRLGDDPSTIADNLWTAPDAGGLVHMWLVLIDSRGGVDYGEYAFDVQ